MNEKVRSVWWLRSILPVPVPTFMSIVGVVEIAAGALVVSRFTRIGA